MLLRLARYSADILDIRGEVGFDFQKYPTSPFCVNQPTTDLNPQKDGTFIYHKRTSVKNSRSL